MRHFDSPLPGFVLLLGALLQTVSNGAARADDLPLADDVELQPLAAQILRVVEALDMLGQPLAAADKAKIDKAIDSTDQKAGVQTLQEVVDRHCLIGIEINPESRVKAAQGPAAPRLVQNGWTVFLVKVHNQAGVTAELQATQSQRRADLQAINQQRGAEEVDPRRRDHRALDGSGHVSRSSPETRPLGTGLSSTGSSRSTAATPASARRRSVSTSARGRRTSAFAATSTSSSPRARRCRWCWTCSDEDGRPDDGLVHLPRPDGTGLSLAQPPAGARLLLPSPDLSPARGETSLLAAGNLSGRVHARPRIPDARRGRSPCPRPRTPSRDVPASSAGSTWPSMNWFSGDHHVHAAGCAPLREPDRGSQARGHVAAYPGRGPRRRLRAELGALLVRPEAVLRGQDPPALHARIPDALRRRGLGLPLVARGPSLPAAAQGRRLSGHHADRGVAELGPARAEVGQVARRGRRLLALGLGPEDPDDALADLRDPALRRHRRQRIHRRRGPRRGRFHLDAWTRRPPGS